MLVKYKLKLWGIIKFPERLLKILPGKQADIFLSDLKVSPESLLRLGFTFNCNDIYSIINNLGNFESH